MSDILRELALAKAVFQLRAIEAVIYAGASGTEAQRATTVKQGVVHDGPVPERQTPITPCNQTTP